jgi:hypothetical protein
MQVHSIVNSLGTANRIQLEHITRVSAAIHIRNRSGDYGGFR